MTSPHPAQNLGKDMESAGSNKPVLVMSVSTGWAIRNFFQTGVVERLCDDFKVVVLATPSAHDGLVKLGFADKVTLVSIEVGREPLSWRLIRQLKKKVYMEGRNSSTEAIWEKYHPRPLYQRIGGRMVKAAIRLANSWRLYCGLDSLGFHLNVDTRFVQVLKQHRPVLYFATHASSYFEECLLRNAQAQKLPVAFMVLSWDHLSSKIVLSRRFDSFLVWNEHTRREIVGTYPCYKPEQIHVVGIPNYDLYAEKPSHSYESWCQKYGLDPACRTILFSTMPQSRHEQQHLIIEELLQAITHGVDLPSDLQVLIKCHPFDDSDEYDKLLGRYPVAIHRTGLAPGQTQDEWIPSSHEISSSRDCLHFCSININIFSTVTIEAAYFDKPIIHIAFDPNPPAPGRIPCHEYYNWDHFKPIVDSNASLMARSYAGLFDAIRRYLECPELLAAERRSLVEMYVGQQIGTASECVATQLAKLASTSSSRPVAGTPSTLNRAA
jgi:hypothetical protein